MEGALIDTVVAVTDTSVGRRFSPTESAVLVGSSNSPGFSLTKSAVVAAGLPRHYPWTEGDQEPGEALWRTMIADAVRGESPAPKEYHAVFHDEWMRTQKRACADYYSDHGIRDPEKEAEWERVWRNADALFPEEDKKRHEDRAAEKAANGGVEVYKRPEKEVVDLVAGPGRAVGFANLAAASGVQSLTEDRFGLWTYRERPEMGKSQTDIMFDELIAACLEDMEKNPRDEDGGEELEGEADEDENVAVDGYEDEKALVKKVPALSLDDKTDPEEQETQVTKPYPDLEEAEKEAEAALQAALEVEQKAKRDARYAARKSKGKKK